MKSKETITDFYKKHNQEHQPQGQFNIYNREEFACNSTSLVTNRRDFYKISLILNGEVTIASAGAYFGHTVPVVSVIWCHFPS